MKEKLQENFLQKWLEYFGKAGLPLAYFYTDNVPDADLNDSKNIAQCLIGNLSRVREGHSYVYGAKTPGCPGGKRYSGYVQKLMPDFEYFLSCGIAGKMDGERYKKTPELVREYLQSNPPFTAPARYLVFKRWDRLAPEDEPAALIFFAGPDVLSGLFTLANFDAADSNNVIAPFGSGCSSILSYTLAESRSDSPRCVLGMFDISARPEVPADILTLTIPMKRFEQMLDNMDESFLITGSWDVVRRRSRK
jgi:hypothetical protein